MNNKNFDDTVLITHKDCLDGSTAAAVFLFFGGKKENIIYSDLYNLSFEEYDKDVIYVDCCPKDLNSCKSKFTVYDHHISNYRLHNEDVRCNFNIKNCGSLFFYESVKNDFLNLLINKSHTEIFNLNCLLAAVNDYDLGFFSNPTGKFLSRLSCLYNQNEFVDILFSSLKDVVPFAKYFPYVDALNLFLSKMKNEILQSSLTFDCNIKNVGCVNAGFAYCQKYLVNDISIEILEKCDIAFCIDMVAKSVSIRSKMHDCSIIADYFGGGGHSGAAGCKFNEQFIAWFTKQQHK